MWYSSEIPLPAAHHRAGWSPARVSPIRRRPRLLVAVARTAQHVARLARNVQRLAARVALDERDHLRRHLAGVLEAADLQARLEADRDLESGRDDQTIPDGNVSGTHSSRPARPRAVRHLRQAVGQLLLDQLVARQRLAKLLAVVRRSESGR